LADAVKHNTTLWYFLLMHRVSLADDIDRKQKRETDREVTEKVPVNPGKIKRLFHKHEQPLFLVL
jgi:hypothetical protein